MVKSDFDLDTVLNDLGQFGLFQWYNYFFIGITVWFSAFYTLSYIFITADLDYRCLIKECGEDISTTNYNTSWLEYAVPFENDIPSSCDRYRSLDSQTCSEDSFDRSDVYQCNEFVYKTTDKTLVNEWNITCNENKWMLTLVGTIQSIGQFIALLYVGYFSDRFGRLPVLIYSILLSTVLGIIKSFSTSYVMYIILELVEPALGSGTFSTAFILGMEIVFAKQRVLGATILYIAFALGEVNYGLIAYFIREWRLLLWVLYIPQFLFVSYFWILPESVRWLIIKEKNDEAVKVLKTMEKMNKRKLSQSVFEDIYKTDEKFEVKETNNGDFMMVLKNSTLLIRLGLCIFAWITNTLVYYGLSLNSVLIEGSQHVNFMLVCAIEIPAYILNYYISHRVGRRWTLAACFMLCGTSVVISGFIPSSIAWLKLLLFLVGKFSISVAFLVTYVFTAELFPTMLRHRCLGLCSMFGRIGSMVAPQTPLMEIVFSGFSTLFMGGFAICASILVLFLPETLNIKLPDTIEESVNISLRRDTDNKS